MEKNNMLNLGCHLSISNGFLKMGKISESIGGNTFQFFSRNPRGGNSKIINQKDIEDLNAFIKAHHFAPVISHAPYTLNACSDKESVRNYAREVFTGDLAMMEFLPENYYNFHPGCHMGQGVKTGIDMIALTLNQILKRGQHTFVLLETMSGKGSEIGKSFEELQAIINKVELTEKIGICLDTCHVFAAGYDIVNDLEGVLEQFDHEIGIQKLKAVHLNDSLMPFNSHKDRHAKIGKGKIGSDAIVKIINHPFLRNLPFLLETPNELSGYKDEIEFLRSSYNE